MARSTASHLTKINTYLNLFYGNNKACISINKTPVRYVRRSRYSKDHNQEELKYQRLLRTFKYESKPLEPDTSVGNEHTVIPENATESGTRCVSDKETSCMVSPQDLIQKLEEKLSPLKHMTYKEQLGKKYNRTLGILRLLGRKLQLLNIPIAMGEDNLPCPVDLVVPSPITEAYRNKDDFNIGLGLDGNEKTVGYFLDPPTEFSTPFCITPNELSIIKEDHKKFAEDFQKYIRLSNLPASQHFSDRGYWKNLIVRSNCAGDLMGIVVIHPQDLNETELQLEKDKLKDYFSSIPKSSYNLQSLYFQACTQSRCTHEQSPFELILGDHFITEETNNMKIHISPDSFFQINTKATESMFNSVLKLCRVKKSSTVLDISCGVGALSCLFSSRVKHCFGIDDSVQAIQDAKRNAVENNVQNAEFIYNRPENAIKGVLTKDYHEDLLVILNSSRCVINISLIPLLTALSLERYLTFLSYKPVITSLREFKSVDKIVYISNKPQTAVDNIVQLCRPASGSARSLGKAFLPILAVPVDLCPHTDQFGLVMMLQRL